MKIGDKLIDAQGVEWNVVFVGAETIRAKSGINQIVVNSQLAKTIMIHRPVATDSVRIDWILKTLHDYGLNGLQRKVNWDIGGPDRRDIDAAMSRDED